MNLRFTLPEREGALFSALCRGEKLIYCVPFDLHDDGSYCADGWIAVTKDRLLVMTDGDVTADLALTKTDEILCIAQVDNGCLLYTS